MSDLREPEAEPHFTMPLRQITLMLVVLGLVAAGLYLGLETIRGIFLANVFLNGAILAVFILGVLFSFAQVYQLIQSVQWIKGFASERVGANLIKAPSLLAPLATLLGTRGARMQISSTSTRSILDSVAQRVDEDRDLTRYIGNTLIFLGLLGTFYGLATTVPALVETIRSLSPEDGESGADVFGRLQQGLESQLGGMGTAFSSSLFGLAGSLVVGLLELFAGHGQNRFYRELEEWLSSITRLGYAGSDDSGNETDGVMTAVVDHLAEQMEAMHATFAEAEANRQKVDERIIALAANFEGGAENVTAQETNVLLTRIAEGQEALLAQMKDEGDGIDAESRMRLRSIDVQMLRILEELTAGRQETVAELRHDLATLTRVLKERGGR